MCSAIGTVAGDAIDAQGVESSVSRQERATAREGLIFQQAYANAPNCAPRRAGRPGEALGGGLILKITTIESRKEPVDP